MTVISLVVFLIVGAIAGWLAGLLVRGRGFGLLGDMLVGIIGIPTRPLPRCCFQAFPWPLPLSFLKGH